MKTRVVCPKCGHHGTADQFVAEAEARQYCNLVAGLPPSLARTLFDYLKLFSPPKRALSWGRALRLGQQIAAAYEKGSIDHKGRTWAAPAPVIESAMATTVSIADKLDLPLRDNAYLWSVIANKANSTEAQAERKQEASRRNRPASTRTVHDDPNLNVSRPAKSLREMLKDQARDTQASTTQDTNE